MMRVAFLLSLMLFPTTLFATDVTYFYKGIVDHDMPFGLAGSQVYGTFSYSTTIPAEYTSENHAKYGNPEAGLFPTFEYHNTESELSVYSSEYTSVTVWNDSSGLGYGDTFVLSGLQLYSPEIAIPPTIILNLVLNDTSLSAFDSTHLLEDLPPVSAYTYTYLQFTGISNSLVNLTSFYRLFPGDTNMDGFVGVDDLNTVLTNWNQTVTPGEHPADIDGNGFVGVDDLNVILSNWNLGTPPVQSNSIPEPSTVAGLAVLSLLALWRRAAG